MYTSFYVENYYPCQGLVSYSPAVAPRALRRHSLPEKCPASRSAGSRCGKYRVEYDTRPLARVSGSVPTMSTTNVALTSSTSQTTMESDSSQQSQTTGNIQEESTTSSMSQSGLYETANEYVCDCAHSLFLVGSPQTTTRLQIGYLSKEEEEEAWEMDDSSQKQLSICYLSPTEESDAWDTIPSNIERIEN
ncbi:uncharacterized protein EV422DRAFT_307231 [Fimicolochytrium jonesii]|uniref:uncharacterized protein n=1 Tax=Fimicolochytrium jonesii TaxID=1396493 RepID=UPI0022FE13B8|nr:uncharacterized protein EV422DRAFT_307231 [Fimicolochytrium jonesii]KAI8824117.1 hypothetical protein EV422DRAFT_307231 [Fimicolochytrium jonesii]